MKKIVLLILMTVWMFSAAACAGKEENQNNTNTPVPTATETPTPTPEPVLAEQSFLPTKEFVRPIGRTLIAKDSLWLVNSGTGCEFSLTGTSVTVKLKPDSSFMSRNNQARVAIYVNGERVVDDMVDKMEKVYTVFESEEPKECTVRVVKLTEAPYSTFGISAIDATCFGNILPTKESDRLIEFVGIPLPVVTVWMTWMPATIFLPQQRMQQRPMLIKLRKSSARITVWFPSAVTELFPDIPATEKSRQNSWFLIFMIKWVIPLEHIWGILFRRKPCGILTDSRMRL